MARSILTFVVSALVVAGLILVARLFVGADVGEPCNDFILSCRATRGMFTVNACVRTGPEPEQSFCSYACTDVSECPEGWTCDPASAWTNVGDAADDVTRACRRP